MAATTIDDCGGAILLRSATRDDRAPMLAVMAPFQNRYFPGGLDSRRTLVAEIGGAIVGFVGWEKDQVLALYVADAWRGKRKVGSPLLDAAEANIRSKGYNRVRIMIDADATGAQRFYMKHDYVTDWNRGNEDIAWMIKEFA